MIEGWGGIGHNSGDTTWPQAEAEAVAPQQTYSVLYPGQPETEEPEAFRERRNAEIQNWLGSKGLAEAAVEQ